MFIFRHLDHGYRVYSQHGNEFLRPYSVSFFEPEATKGLADIDLPITDCQNRQLTDPENDGLPMTRVVMTWCEVVAPGEEPTTHFPMVYTKDGWVEGHTLHQPTGA